MGEVYTARDTRLDRTVAIKVLPEHVASDPDLKQRFEREAKTVAALSHPHICPVFDVGSQDGIDFLVMEYLEGETLAQRLEKGALPLDQALEIAIEIADALDKAHRQGIVHRDLKPGNIMLTKSGAKLLDFGLAKLRQPGTVGAEGLSAAATRSEPLTGKGTLLGTVQYMAPEQLEGKEADARTDIFAFGALVYEMVTGQRAFAGDSRASLIHAIIGVDPPAMSTLQSMSSPALDQIVRTCQAKDPENRWHSAGDVVRQLKWIVQSGSQPSKPVATAPQPQKRQGAMPMLGAALIGGVIIGLAVWGLTRPGPAPPRPLTRFVVTTPPDEPLRMSGELPEVAISPDGLRIVYGSGAGGSRQLYLREVTLFGATPLRGTEGGSGPFFSPDGEWIGFSTDYLLKRVSILGGPAATICDLGGAPAGMSWGPDDTIVYATAGSQGLLRVPAVGGEPERLTTVEPEQDETDHLWPEVLPNGQAVLFTAWSGSPESSRLAIVSLETGAVSYLPVGSDPSYSPTGHIVYSVGGALWAVGFDVHRLEVTSNPVPVLENVNTKALGAANFSMSGDGSLVYVAAGGTGGGSRTLVWVDRDGREEPLGYPPDSYTSPRLSPDGTRVAVDVIEPENSDVWTYDLTRPTRTRLTTDPAIDQRPLWTPDGQRVVFQSNRDSQSLFWKLADGTGEAERLMTAREGATFVFPAAWSADGKTLVYQELVQNNRIDIGLLSMDGERPSEMLLATEFLETAPAVSPDGGWIAYASDESGAYEVYVQQFPHLSERVTVSTDGGHQPVWSPDGRELFYRGPLGMMVVPVETDPTFRPGAPEVLFEGQYYSFLSTRTYDVAPDGRFLMIKEAAVTTDDTSVTAGQIVLVQNWTDELQRLVPAP